MGEQGEEQGGAAPLPKGAGRGARGEDGRWQGRLVSQGEAEQEGEEGKKGEEEEAAEDRVGLGIGLGGREKEEEEQGRRVAVGRRAGAAELLLQRQQLGLRQ